MKITTESGRKYLIEDGFWTRLSKQEGGRPDGPHRIWALKSGDVLAWPWNDPTDSFVDVNVPIVGKFMFVSSRDLWWTTTRVVSVEGVEA